MIGTGPHVRHTHPTLALSLPSTNMGNGEKKGRLHSIKDRLSPSSRKPSRRSGSPIPPDASSDKDQQRSWSLREFLGKPARSRSTSPLPPLPESPLSRYPIVS